MATDILSIHINNSNLLKNMDEKTMTLKRIKGMVEEFIRGLESKEKLTFRYVVKTIEAELDKPYLTVEDVQQMLTEFDTIPSYHWNITQNPEQKDKITKLKKQIK